jgi:hypothetical protein
MHRTDWQAPHDLGGRQSPSISGRWRVTKKLLPGQPGTLKLARRHGSALVCVRYRLDEAGLRRITTVELVVEQAIATHRAERMVAVRLHFEEVELRATVLERGARWDKAAKVWRMPRRVAIALNLSARIVQK